MSLGHEAMHRALSGGYRKVAARAAGVSDSTVEAWVVPPRSLGGSGLACPAQRFVDIQLELKRDGHPDPFYMLHNACRELGFLPPQRNDAVAEPVSVDHIAKATREFGELLTAIATASADGILSVADADRIYEEAAQLHTALAPILRQMQSVVVEGEESSIRERRGPQRVLPTLLQLRRLA